MPIISVSGLRGIIGQSLPAEVILRYVAAFAKTLPAGPILLSRDGRPSGEPIVNLLIGSLTMQGRNVIDAGVCATPTVGVLTRDLQCAGAIQISASHNPPEYNGLKLMGADGRVISAAEGEAVLQRFHQSEPVWVDHTKLGSCTKQQDSTTAHTQFLLSRVHVELIKQQKYHVLLDANGGAGSILGRKILEQLGCQVTVLGEGADGNFLHPPEPTAENLTNVGQQVTKLKANLGFCQDPDADRLAVIDEQGCYLGEEYTLALCLENILPKQPGAVVVNCATSRMNQDIAGKYDCPFHVAKVGEANVTGMMHETNAVFGGEGNGGPIDPQVGYIRDSFVGMTQILELMAQRNQPLSQLAAEIPRYEILKTKVQIDREKIPAALEQLAKHFSEATANYQDGLRLDWPDRWLLIRASNTEPIVRVIAETKSKNDSQTLCDQAKAIIEKVS